MRDPLDGPEPEDSPAGGALVVRDSSRSTLADARPSIVRRSAGARPRDAFALFFLARFRRAFVLMLVTSQWRPVSDLHHPTPGSIVGGSGTGQKAPR
jgi:hypothetical protein